MTITLRVIWIASRKHVTKTNALFSQLLARVVATSLFINTSVLAAGIPEPGSIMYGSVSNQNGRMPLVQGSVQWTITGGGSMARISSTIANVNGQYFYIAQIPFETRAVLDATFPPGTNTLPLTEPATTFARYALALGTNATIAPPKIASFNFSKSDRGKIERVDLMVSLPVEPSLDTDGDGVPDWAEQIAGTDPQDPNSVFKASTDIQPALGGGLIIKWASIAGKTYSIERSTDLAQGFTSLANNISAAVPENQYIDSTAIGSISFFYRIRLNP